MFIRWSFIYKDKTFAAEVRDEKEDVRISDCVNNMVDLLLIPSPGKDVYLNLKYCEAIIREEVNEEAKAPEILPEVATAEELRIAEASIEPAVTA